SASEEIEKILGRSLEREYRVMDLLRRPEIPYQALMQIAEIGPGVTDRMVYEQVEIAAKYAGYLTRQQIEISQHSQYETTEIPEDMNYAIIPGLSHEVRQKLMMVKPTTLGQALRIPGVTRAAISLLLIYLKKRNMQ